MPHRENSVGQKVQKFWKADRPPWGLLDDVTGDQLGHFKHRNLFLATEYDLESGVRIDHPPVGCVLQTIFLDVVPEFLGQFAPRNRSGTHDFG